MQYSFSNLPIKRYKKIKQGYDGRREKAGWNDVQKIIDYLKITDAADFLGVTPNTLRNWERDKKITVYRNPQNAYRLYKREDLEQILGNIKPV